MSTPTYQYFQSTNFIRTYTSTDRFIQIIYPNGNRFYNLNVCQRKKIIRNSNKLEIWTEGNLSTTLPFISIADAELAFVAINEVLDALTPNCIVGTTNPPTAQFSIIPITYTQYKVLQNASNLLVHQFYDVTDTANDLGLGVNYVYRVLTQKTNDWSPFGMCLNNRANVTINTFNNIISYLNLGELASSAHNNSRITITGSMYVDATNNSTIIAVNSNYIQASNNSTLDVNTCNNIRVYDGANCVLENCNNCEFVGIVTSGTIDGYEDIIVDKKSSVGKSGYDTHSTSGALELISYKDSINQKFTGISGQYDVELTNPFQEANSVFRIKFGTITSNITFTDTETSTLLFTATPADSNTDISFRWDIANTTYVYEATSVKVLHRIQLTVVTNGQTNFPNVLSPIPYDAGSVKMFINGQQTTDFSVSGNISIIYNATDFALETDDTVYIEYI